MNKFSDSNLVAIENSESIWKITTWTTHPSTLNTKLKPPRLIETTLSKQLDAIVAGITPLPFPSIERGRERINENTNNERQYFAFGSDDIIQQTRANKSKFDGLQAGKEMFQKFGSFLSTSVSTLISTDEGQKSNGQKDTKQSNNEPSGKDQGEQDSKEKQDKLVEIKDDLKNISSKIGKGFLSFGVV